MRRFEFKNDKSSKFWEIAQKDSKLLLRWGKIGTDGQRKEKAFASPEKAVRELEKQVRAKLKKDYLEVGASEERSAEPNRTEETVVTTPQNTASKSLEQEEPPGPMISVSHPDLPPEDEPIWPEAWRELFLDAPETQKARATKSAIEQELTWRAKNGLKLGTGRLQDPSPISITESLQLNDRSQTSLAPWVDYWIAHWGIVPVIKEITNKTHERYGSGRIRSLRVLHRLKEHLDRRPDLERQDIKDKSIQNFQELDYEARAILFFLFKDPKWVDALYAHIHQPIRNFDLDRSIQRVRGWLIAADEPPEELEHKDRLLFQHQGVDDLLAFLFVSLKGRALVYLEPPYLQAYRQNNDEEGRVAEVLACFPHPESFRRLIRMANKNRICLPHMLRCAESFPRMASTVLAKQGTHKILLKQLCKTFPALSATLESVLTGASLAFFQSCSEQLARGPVADQKNWPSYLRQPAWLNKKPKFNKVVEVAPFSFPSAMSWEPDEKEKWLAESMREFHLWHGQTYAFAPDITAQELLAEFFNDPISPSEAICYTPAAPEKAARELLTSWDGTRAVSDVFQHLIPRFGLDVLPHLKAHFAEERTQAVQWFGPFLDSELIELAAEGAANFKSIRKECLSYLARHREWSIRTLLPQTFTEDKKQSKKMQDVLSMLFDGYESVGEEIAKEYGQEMADAFRQVFAEGALNQYPSKLPKLPKWLDLEFLPQLHLRNGQALGAKAVEHLVTMMAFSTFEQTYKGIRLIKQDLDPQSLSRFAWSLFELWLHSGGDSRGQFALLGLGWFGDDEVVRNLTPMIRRWPGESLHKRATVGIEVLRKIGTDLALSNLYSISQKLKFPALKRHAVEQVESLAKSLNLTTEQLTDRLVPDLDLPEIGCLEFDYGERSFKLRLNEKLEPSVVDDKGKTLKNLPKAGKNDDADKAKLAKNRFKNLKKDLKDLAKTQLTRFERAMLDQRRWSSADFRRYFLQHPVLKHLCQRLVWGTYEGEKLIASFRFDETSQLVDQQDEIWTLPKDATVGLPHPLQLPAAALQAWGTVFADYQILQPFVQLSREVFRLEDNEKDHGQFPSLKDKVVPTGILLSLEKWGWTRGAPQQQGRSLWSFKSLANDLYMVLQFEDGIVADEPLRYPEQTIGFAGLSRSQEGEVADWLRAPEWDESPNFTEISPLEYSEIVRDLTTSSLRDSKSI